MPDVRYNLGRGGINGDKAYDLERGGANGGKAQGPNPEYHSASELCAGGEGGVHGWHRGASKAQVMEAWDSRMRVKVDQPYEGTLRSGSLQSTASKKVLSG